MSLAKIILEIIPYIVPFIESLLVALEDVKDYMEYALRVTEDEGGV